jgi:hypothetical protein
VYKEAIHLPKGFKKILRIATLGFTKILDFLYPPKCPICNDPTIDQVGFCGSLLGRIAFRHKAIL